MSERFQVDLAGMVDLLSKHLYSGPQVYLRELLQNAVDALTARQELDPRAPATVRLVTSVTPDGSPVLEITDSGIGLTADQAREFLATIGRSSKRDPEFGLARRGFLGQFGIGMMAAFMVAETIEVTSCSALPGAVGIRWAGRSDGTFDVSADPSVTTVGTRVRLVGRHELGHWLDHDSVLSLAREYGSLLPFDIAVEVEVAGVGAMWRRITTDVPWQVEYAHSADRAAALARFCEDTLGFTPIGHIDLTVPLSGVSGVAFILPASVGAGAGQHRLYAKRMLLGPRVGGVLPEWAFFVRAVLDSDALSPTASREQLHSDEVLLATREALGEQLKTWARQTLTGRSTLARRFIETHHLALRALARTDDDMVDLVAQVLPFETSEGTQTLTEVAQAGGEVVYTTTTQAYRRISAVARAQGLCVVNAGYVYDADLLERLGRRPRWRVRELSSTDLTQVLAYLDPAREAALGPALVAARAALAADDCDVILRRFAPDTVPAVLLRDAEGEHRRDRERESAAAPGLWDGLLDAFAGQGSQRSRTLVLNDNAAIVGDLVAAHDTPVFADGLRSLYLSAVMLAGEGLRSEEVTGLNNALGSLLSAALGRTPDTRKD